MYQVSMNENISMFTVAVINILHSTVQFIFSALILTWKLDTFFAFWLRIFSLEKIGKFMFISNTNFPLHKYKTHVLLKPLTTFYHFQID